MKSIPIPPTILAYIGISIIIAVTLYLVFKRIGLIEDLTLAEKKNEKKTKEELSKEEQDVDLANVIISDMKEFNPLYWEKAKKSELLNETQARNEASKINAAIGIFYDNESAIYATFRMLSNKFQVSQLAFYYAANYNRDLVGDLTRNLSNYELNQVVKIVKNLPE
jgi:hypothetical protein